MEARKNPKYDLQRYKSIFFNIGLVVSLLFVIAAFEWRFYDKIDIMAAGGSMNIEFEDILDVPPTEQPPPPAPKVQDIRIIEVQDMEEIEDEIDINLDIEMTEETVIEERIEAEVADIEEEETEEVFVIVEHKPVPKGGMQAFYAYVNKEFEYPRQARELRIEGKVFVQFVIEKDGSISNVIVAKGVGGGCDEEAIRVVEKSPNWNPGKQRGQPVRVRMVLPITFKLMN
jgi:protein TonB